MLQAVVDPAECIWLGSLVLGGSDRRIVKHIHHTLDPHIAVSKEDRFGRR